MSQQTVKLGKIQPANKSHVVSRLKAGRLKYFGDPDLQEAREGSSGGSEEYQLRIGDNSGDLGKYVVVCGLIT